MKALVLYFLRMYLIWDLDLNWPRYARKYDSNLDCKSSQNDSINAKVDSSEGKKEIPLYNYCISIYCILLLWHRCVIRWCLSEHCWVDCDYWEPRANTQLRSFTSPAELFYHSFPHNDFYHNKVPQNWLKMHHGVFRKRVGLKEN